MKFRTAPLCALLGILLAATASATVFVPPASLPGITIADNDVRGETWGRAGGRTITYTVANPSQYSLLVFGIGNGSVPTLAFDNNLTPNTGEYMSFDNAASDLNGGVARWHGSAVLTYFGGSTQTVLTRFTLTVHNAAGPLALSNGAATPGVNVLTSGPFTVNLLFEASPNNGQSWQAALDFYDAAQTPQGNPQGTSGPVLSGVSYGFYYDIGLTLDAHDANMNARFDGVTGQLNGIKTDTGYLHDDWNPKWNQIYTDLFNDTKKITDGQQDLSKQIMNLQFPNIPQDIASKQDVKNAAGDAQQGITQTLLILWGILDCKQTVPPEQQAVCDSIKFTKDLATQKSVDALTTSVGDVATNVNTINTNVGALPGQISTVNGNVLGLVTPITTINTNVGLLPAQIGTVDTHVTGLGTQIGTVDTHVTGLGTQLNGLATAASLSATTQTINGIQTKVEALPGQISTVNASVLGLATPITTINTNVGLLPAQISTVDSHVTGLGTQLNGLATAASLSAATQTINGIQTKVDALPGQITTVDSHVTNLGTQLNGLATAASLSTATQKIDAIQTKVDAIQASVNAALTPHLDVQVTEITDPATTTTTKQRRFIVKSTKQGVPADGHVFAIIAVRAPKGSAAVSQNVTSLATIVPLAAGTGLNDVTLDIVKDMSDGAAFTFDVHAIDSSGLTGTALIAAK